MTEEKQNKRALSSVVLHERAMTIPKAATVLGISYRQLLAAVDSGQVPYYRAAKCRRMVFMSEVLASICSKQIGEVR